MSSAIDAILAGGTQIRREIILPIEHCLMSNCALTDVERVYSHPQALAQCRDWLMEALPRAQLVHTASTTLAVREAMSDDAGAAVGSSLASEIHGLDIVRERIQDHHENATRFVMIGTEDGGRTGDDRTTVTFRIDDDNAQGSLRRTLAAFDGINLTRIESRPRRGKAWRYVFVVDLEGHRTDPDVAAALAALQTLGSDVQVLGSYPRDRLEAV